MGLVTSKKSWKLNRAPEEVASVVSFRQKKKKREGQFLLNVLTANDRSDRCGKQSCQHVVVNISSNSLFSETIEIQNPEYFFL